MSVRRAGHCKLLVEKKKGENLKKILILFSAIVAYAADAQTTNWYVDGEIYQTTTCESGDDVTPPSAPARRGYTFTGWREIIAGTWRQSGTPTPSNPIYPTFYQDGDLILRAVGAGANLIADTYDPVTGVITRRVGVKVLDGTEEYTYSEPNTYGIANITSEITGKVDGNTNLFMCSHFVPQTSSWYLTQTEGIYNGNNNNQVFFRVLGTRIPSLSAWTQYLADQYAAGTPVTVYYPLATPIEETYTPNSNQD